MVFTVPFVLVLLLGEMKDKEQIVDTSVEHIGNELGHFNHGTFVYL